MQVLKTSLVWPFRIKMKGERGFILSLGLDIPEL